jgi:hypothetical protein
MDNLPKAAHICKAQTFYNTFDQHIMTMCRK